MMEKLKIKFIDFWNGFDYRKNIVYQILKNLYDVEVIENNDDPDILICSLFGKEVLKYHNIKTLLFSGENTYPDFNIYDYTITCHNLYPGRNLCIPYFALESNIYEMNALRKYNSAENPEKRKFCSCLISNSMWADPRRETLFKDLYSYKAVDSGGISMNTLGYSISQDKNVLDFFKGYKFNVAAENSDVEGYVTEKIVNAFCSYTVPIYFGNSETVNKYFNELSFINYNKFRSKSDFIEYIRNIDNNKDDYSFILNQDPLKCNPEEFKDKIKDFLLFVINGKTFDHDFGNIGIQNKLLLK